MNIGCYSSLTIGDYTAKSNDIQKILQELDLGKGRKIVKSLRICDMLWVRKKVFSLS